MENLLMPRRIFIRYCEGLDIHTYESELEHYEKIGEMLPVALDLYGYWQVHQLYQVQQVRRNKLPEYLDSQDQSRYLSHLLLMKRSHITFDNKTVSQFRALHHWMSKNELEKQRKLKSDTYEKNLQNYADSLIKQYGMSRGSLYSFLICLIRLYENYMKYGSRGLARKTRNLIIHLEALIEINIGEGLDEISDELRLRSSPNPEKWDARTFTVLDSATTFRHLCESTKERDYALHTIKRKTANLTIDWSLSAQDADSLVRYCEKSGLDLMLTALGSLSAVGEEEYLRNFRPVCRYSNLASALTMYEVFLKSVTKKEHPDIGDKNLGEAINTTMCKESWFASYKDMKKDVRDRIKDAENFICKLQKVRTNCELQTEEAFWARMFLITYLSRNFVSHQYTDQDSVREKFTGPFYEALDAVILAMCYTWKLAQSRKWV